MTSWMCLISSSFTWLITKLVSDFAGVSICPRKKALHANKNQIKLKILHLSGQKCNQSYLVELIRFYIQSEIVFGKISFTIEHPLIYEIFNKLGQSPQQINYHCFIPDFQPCIRNCTGQFLLIEEEKNQLQITHLSKHSMS